ncbi:MAG: 1-acyl-sn-glycerol-3-phosphate acyltransferase [Candidatus Cryptobacteroides sp.]
MKKIYDRNIIYDILHPLVDLAVKASYRQMQVTGKSYIPKDGAVIIAPNHTNALMDALVILSCFGDATIFGARADIFRKPFLARLFFNLRMIPMPRVRDGIREVAKNHEIAETVYEAMEHGMRFCLFPEGTHRPAHSLMHVGKGVVRMALEANARFGGKKPVYIVPTGIEYSDFFRFRGKAQINFARPINVTEFVVQHPELSEVQLLEPLRAQLEASMRGQISYAENDEYMNEHWTLATMLGREQMTLYSSMNDRREILGQIQKCFSNRPAECAALLEKVRRFDSERRAAGISRFSLKAKMLPLRCILKTLVALLALPLVLFALFVTLPQQIAAALIVPKIKDEAFRNTARFGVKLGGNILMTPLWAALCFCLIHPWYYALMTLFLCFPAYGLLYDYREFLRVMVSDFRLLGKPEARCRHDEIINEFNQLNK